MSGQKKKIDHEAVVRRFGERLKEVRRGKGMTQADLAEKTAITASYIGRLERAGAAPGIDLVARLAAALGTTIADLLPEADPPDQAPVLREQARRLFDGIIKSDDVVTLQLLTQFLARLADTTPTGE
jgi:transcriptional regulator with XRE-family HTH domain